MTSPTIGSPARILHVKPGQWGVGGVETFIVSMFERVDRARLVFDVLTIGDSREETSIDRRLLELGGRRFAHVELRHGPTASKIGPLRTLRRLVREEGYDVVHIHTGSPLHGLYAYAARSAGAKTAILHSHTSGGRELPGAVKVVADVLLDTAPTDRAACSKDAARWLFPERVQESVRVFRNGVDVDAFHHDAETRRRLRAELDLGEALVIGHVGRFSFEKNHPLMLRVLADMCRTAADTAGTAPTLVLVGDGEERPAVEALADKLGVTAQVRFVGLRDDIPSLMNAMDVLLLPSEAEGLGIVGLEAQAAGLPCVFSTGVPTEIDVTGRCRFVPTDANPAEWAVAIQTMAALGRADTGDDVRRAGYDATACAADLETFYLSALASANGG